MAKQKKDNSQFDQSIRELEALFASTTLTDASDPEVYREVCREYGEIVRPGLNATDRALLLSRATAHTRVYKSS